ncbi:hypothetical protein COOONC_15724 [Cooperia oncophora]
MENFDIMDSHTSRDSPVFVPASPTLSDICWQCRYCPAARDCGHPEIPADGEHEEEGSYLECGKAAACIRDLNSRAREEERRCIELAKELRRHQVEMEREVVELGEELRASERRFRNTLRLQNREKNMSFENRMMQELMKNEEFRVEIWRARAFAVPPSAVPLNTRRSE